jgi:hypothetical protein
MNGDVIRIMLFREREILELYQRRESDRRLNDRSLCADIALSNFLKCVGPKAH